MKNLLYSFPLLLLLGTGSCYKEKKPTYSYLTQEVKDWMYFKKGTYWIYCDALTGKEDSVWVDSSYIEMKDYGAPSRNAPYIIYETFYVYQKTTFDDYIYVYLSRMGVSLNYPNNTSYPNSAIVKMDRKSTNGNEYEGFNVLYLPAIEGAGGGNIKKIRDSLEVGGKYYKNVVEYEAGHFVSKYYGVIRIAGRAPYFEGTNYNKDLQLVRYKIVQ